MKINKYTFILPILFCIIIYLFGAFIAANFNIVDWAEGGRFFIALLCIAVIILGIGFSQEIE